MIKKGNERLVNIEKKDMKKVNKERLVGKKKMKY